MLERQVHITGRAQKLSAMENLKYFSSRPKDSQLAAIASHQSQRISARGILEGKFLELKQKFAKGEIPVPSFWGGTEWFLKVSNFGRVGSIACTTDSFIPQMRGFKVKGRGRLTDWLLNRA